MRAASLKANSALLALLVAGCNESLSPDAGSTTKYEIKFSSSNEHGSWKAALVDGKMDRSELAKIGREACGNEERICNVQFWKDPLFVPSSENPDSQSEAARLAKYWRAAPGIASETEVAESISFNCQRYRDVSEQECSGGSSDYDIAFDACIAIPRKKGQSDKDFMESCKAQAKKSLSPETLKTLGID